MNPLFLIQSVDWELTPGMVLWGEIGNKKSPILGVPIMTQRKQIWLETMRLQNRSLASLSGLEIWRCHELGEGRRHGSDLMLLWLWHRPAAVALTGPLAWELPYATSVALKRKKKKKKYWYCFWRETVPVFRVLTICNRKLITHPNSYRTKGNVGHEMRMLR